MIMCPTVICGYFLAVALVCIYLLKAGLNYFIQYYGHIVGVRMQSDMRRDMFQKLQKLPFSYFDENKTGTVMSRMINDLMDISELAHHGPENLFLSLILLVGSFVILCTINPLLTLIVYAALPFIIFLRSRCGGICTLPSSAPVKKSQK